MGGLNRFAAGLTVEKILVLDVTPNEPLPHNELPLIWFMAEILQRIWRCRKYGKVCHLETVRAQLANAVELITRSNYSDMVPILHLMMDNNV